MISCRCRSVTGIHPHSPVKVSTASPFGSVRRSGTGAFAQVAPGYAKAFAWSMFEVDLQSGSVRWALLESTGEKMKQTREWQEGSVSLEMACITPGGLIKGASLNFASVTFLTVS